MSDRHPLDDEIDHTRDGLHISGALFAGGATICIPCGAPAPLVLSGGAYVGCSQPKEHEGFHEITVRWER